ncbi:TPA: hypothetical protein ACWWCX_002365 [Enterococcus faecium]
MEYKRYSGNRFSLRAKTNHIIKRLDFVSNHLGPLGELLVSTWESLAITIIPIGLGIFLVGYIGFAERGNLIKENAIPSILIILGVLLVSLNTLMVNPSYGSQFVVSIKFLLAKLKSGHSSEKIVNLNIFKFSKEIIEKNVIETEVNGKEIYLVMYDVRGSVSGITFDSELERLAFLDSQLLSNFERDTILSTINSIQPTKIVEKKLPKNATEDMIKKRNMNHKIVSSLKYNHKIDTKIMIAAPNFDVLRERIDSIEKVFQQGLVIGYRRLKGKELKKNFNEIYGEMR